MARTSKSRGATPFTMKSGNSTPFKMMGSSPMRVDPEKKKEKSDKDELVSYTDPNYQPDWGSASLSDLETKISKGTMRLINAGAPKEVIEAERIAAQNRRIASENKKK